MVIFLVFWLISSFILPLHLHLSNFQFLLTSLPTISFQYLLSFFTVFFNYHHHCPHLVQSLLSSSYECCCFNYLWDYAIIHNQNPNPVLIFIIISISQLQLLISVLKFRSFFSSSLSFLPHSNLPLSGRP